MKYLFILFCCLPSIFLLGQNKFDYVWVSGLGSPDNVKRNTLLNFNTDPPTPTLFGGIYEFEKRGSICNAQGELQFMTNGCYVLNKYGSLMQGGDSLSYDTNGYNPCFGYPGASYTHYQGIIILPNPSNLNQYYIFSKIDGAVAGILMERKIFYSLVDMTLDSGLGKVVLKNKLLLTDAFYPPDMSASRHANGRDWWLLFPQRYTNKYFRFLLTPAGIETYPPQSLGPPTTGGDGGGNAIFSPDGAKYIRYNPKDRAFIFDFNRCEGTLSNAQVINVADTVFYGSAAVSPNSRYLYINTSVRIYQFDLLASDIQLSRKKVALWDRFIDTIGGYPRATRFDNMMLGPDGKIYVECNSGAHYLHRINFPDLADTLCQVEQRAILMPHLYYAGGTYFPNYRLGRLVGSSCDTLATAIAEVEQLGELRVQPNPATDLLHIAYHTENTTALTVAISDYTGKKIQTLSLDSASGSLDINTSALPNGLYLCTLYDSATHRQQSVKFVVMR